jgi:hypothetical protein
LTHVVGALHPASSLSGSLYCRKQQTDENTNDRDHHEKLYESEGTTTNE